MILKNSFYLFLLQGINYLVPLLLLPFFIRTLGVESYGEIAIWLALIQFAYIVTDFGFTLSATRIIARFQSDKLKISKYVSTIFASKLILIFFASSMIIFYSVFTEGNFDFALAAIFTIMCQAYQPVWFYHGIERMSSVVIYFAASKILYLALVLLFVDDENDGLMILLFWGASQFIAALIACCEYFYRGYTFIIPQAKDVLRLLKTNINFFTSRLSVASFTTMNTVVIGVVGTSTQVAHFAICDQVFKAGQALTSPVTQALYPYMQRTKDWKLYVQVTFGFFIFLVVSLVLFSQFSEYFINLIFGKELLTIKPLLEVFLCIIVVNFLGRNTGYPIYGAIDKINFAHRTVQLGAIIHITVIFLFIAFSKLDPYFLAITILFTESVILVARLFGIYIWRNTFTLKNNDFF